MDEGHPGSVSDDFTSQSSDSRPAGVCRMWDEGSCQLRGVLIAIIFTETIRSRAHLVLGRGNGDTRRRHT